MPASRVAFVTALQSEGFQVTSDGLVYGLVLKSDLEAHLRLSTPERRTRKNNDYSHSKSSKCVRVPVKSTAILGSREKNERNSLTRKPLESGVGTCDYLLAQQTHGS